jgi:hypothetical protein
MFSSSTETSSPKHQVCTGSGVWEFGCGGMEDPVIVRRFAVKYHPPTLVVEYKTDSGLFLKKIKIKPKPVVCFPSLLLLIEDYLDL